MIIEHFDSTRNFVILHEMSFHLTFNKKLFEKLKKETFVNYHNLNI